jgi:cellobiose phosphorylase
MKNYGYFTSDDKEYIITEKNLPRNWDQFIWNKTFMCKVSNDGSGTSFYKHPDGMRTTLCSDRRVIYIKDNDSGEVIMLPDDGITAYGIGYARFEAEKNNLRTEFRISVPQNAAAEGWTINLENKSSSAKNISIYTYINPDLTGYFTPFGVKCYKVAFNGVKNLFTYENADAYCPTTHFNGYFCADTKIDGFETVGEMFFGAGQNRSFINPYTVKNDTCSNILYQGGGGNHGASDMINVMKFNINLAANEQKQIQILCGIYEENNEIENAMRQYMNTGALDTALEQYISDFDKKSETYSIQTPDKTFNRLYNIWGKYNLMFTGRWTRIYSRGFRDILQDTMALCSLDKDLARENILTAAAHIYNSGKCIRAWDNVSTTLSTEFYADGPVWLPMAVNEYIKETGDTEILKEKCPYYDFGADSLLDHMLKAVKFLYNDKGSHGLSLIHDGDWLDSMHLVGTKGKGEGVWLTIALYKALKDLSELLEYLGDYKNKKEIDLMAETTKDTVNKYGWDGRWFLQAYNDAGNKVGGSECAEGKIYTNPQSWAVMSGITSPERENLCFEILDNELDSRFGSRMLTPPYTKQDSTLGTTTGFAPGTFGNGSSYCHVSAFKIVADCKRGRGNKAYETMNKIIPGGTADLNNEISDCPPYAFTNGRVAPEHPYLAGRCLGLWNTATVAWCWFALSEYMLGIRKTFDGLTVNPCIPQEWEKCSAVRYYRGAKYIISIYNPSKKQTGVNKITVNGKLLSGDILPYEKGGEYDVQVIM